MIDFFTTLQIAAGFAFLALAGLTCARQRPSFRRLERVVTFASIGAVLIATGTAVIAHRVFVRRNPDLAETIFVVTLIACIAFYVVGFPAVHLWAARRYGHRPAGAADFAEDRGGNAVRLPKE